jgi:hypothetical protein
MTTPEDAHTWLTRQGAQHDLVEWARAFGADFARLWAECPRGDWLLALAARLGVPREALLAATCGCVRPALEYIPEDELHPLACLDALAACSRGEGHDESRAAHRSAQRDSLLSAHGKARDPAEAEALLAFVAALDAVNEPSAAAGAAGFAAHAAMLATSDCAMIEALRYSQRMQADAVRAVISVGDATALFLARTGPQRAA